MFGNLTAAFGLTVLCLAPILLVALFFPPILMRLARPKANDGEKPQGPNPVRSFFNFGRFYLITLIVMVTVTILFWWGYLSFNSVNEVVDFASQSLPVEREAVEEAVEPALTVESEQTQSP